MLMMAPTASTAKRPYGRTLHAVGQHRATVSAMDGLCAEATARPALIHSCIGRNPLSAESERTAAFVAPCAATAQRVWAVA